ncbi:MULTISPECIES: substrate-binding domain-containing protein [unclassified Nocardioides]|jgi:ABC-type phosphate transport system substrate-binding protein|uniref:substrate-binding domain-containing protein n=1 Tax=unclassified Nocardioides TaxID=2615069 RepID=UPI0009EB95E3|nr:MULTISPECIES: substrate-binding domain-containing protein [unclassified Nocardioides]
MLIRRTSASAAVLGLATLAGLALTLTPAHADPAPQPDDVVATGSDIIQNSFNFLADGYHQLPGYNTAGNRFRFINFDSSGDAQGRSGFTDPRLLPTITGNGTIGDADTKYVKQSDIKLLNPTIALRAGQDLVVRPTGGGGGGRDAIINDDLDWIDVGRSPDALNDTHQNLIQSKQGTKLYRIQIATDRQLIATATTTNAPATLSADTILKIYNGTYDTWGDIPGYAGPAPSDTIIPLILPTDAGMWNTFVKNVGQQNPGVSVTSDSLRSNPNKIQVQQNDPTAITSLGALAKNAIVPFPRGRYRTLNTGYYTQTFDGQKTNNYNTETGHRTPADASGIKLLDGDSTSDQLNASAPYGGNFAYNALVRESDLTSNEPWQPGSTLNWVEALFYNPDGPLPFVRTPAGQALLEAAGVTPDYHVFGTNNAEIPVD